MITWNDYPLFALFSFTMWAIGLIAIYLPRHNKHNHIITHSAVLTGIAVQLAFIGMFWHFLERPPMRTLGETRLWYSLFIPVIGYLYFVRWRYSWVLAYSIMLATVFMLINILKPEMHDKTLMPALQSPWFVPHVIVYMFAYALLAVSSLVAIKGLWQLRKNQFDETLLKVARSLVRTGFAFLSFGLIFGALWAKEAWGHYWTWDPKEIWAMLTWLAYMLYLHTTYYYPRNARTQLWILALSFLLLLICWFGVNYLASAASSVHTYSS